MGGLDKRKLDKPRGQPQHKLLDKKEKSSWDKKQKDRDRLKRIRTLQKQLKTEINDEQKRATDSRKANAVRRVENEKKNMVVQEIKNVKAIKKLSPKHRRKARIFMKYELN